MELIGDQIKSSEIDKNIFLIIFLYSYFCSLRPRYLIQRLNAIHTKKEGLRLLKYL